jgi:hypothetical protein
MDITTEYRSHWIAADGTRYATRRGPDGVIRSNLQPIVNLEEVRAYADLGDKVLPQSGFTSQWFARQLLEHPKSYMDRAHLLVEELTDGVPHYRTQWRQPFLDLRNSFPSVDGKPVVSAIFRTSIDGVWRALQRGVAYAEMDIVAIEEVEGDPRIQIAKNR